MPLFFFHIRRQNDFEADLDGITFDSINDARDDAENSLREIVAEELRAGRLSDILGIEIADNKGELLTTITIDEAVLNPLAAASGVATD